MLASLFFADLSYFVALRPLVLLSYGSYYLGNLDIIVLAVNLIVVAFLAKCSLRLMT